ncbi:methyl-accepting chemotaxis protein [Thalassotalea euphylliae]|nr:methyl-accepting chemotaxis protein [Thalassotalea euphylliae]
MGSGFWKLYSFIETSFFYTLSRKIIGNIGFLLLFQIAAFVLFLQLDGASAEQTETILTWGKTLFALSFLAFGFTLFYLHYLFVRPIKAILASLQNINSHDGDLTTQLPAFTHDEFRQLSERYNTFVANLSELLNTIHSNSEQANSATDSVVHAVAVANDKANSQKQLSEQIFESSNHINNSISHIVDASETVATSNKSSLDKAMSANQQLTQIQEQTAQIGALLGQFATTVDGLQQNAGNIRNILKMVEEFADQTNLLALNAAIEAARAGDAGRGFAVVADEVRSLSSKVADATQQITSFINDMDSLVTDTKTESDKLVDQSQQTHNTIEETNSTFAQMMTDFNANTKEFDAISDAIHELNAQYLQTHSNVENISSLSETLQGQMQQANNEAQVAQTQAEQTQNRLSRFAR